MRQVLGRVEVADRAPPGGPATSAARALTSRAINRRQLAGLALGGLPLAWVAPPALAALAPPPQVGDCADCIGEVEGSLNACPLSARSCVSSQNDDVAHFAGPWVYEGSREEAVAQLVGVATGGRYNPGLRRDPLSGEVGISRSDAAGFILGTVGTTLQGKPPPEKPKRRVQAVFVPFDGRLVDRHTTADGSEYVRLEFGAPAPAPARGRAATGPAAGGPPEEGGEAPGVGGAAEEEVDAANVVDAEFVFPPGDSIAMLRASSRAEPQALRGRLQLSFQSGVVFDANLAAARLEVLRKALRWDVAPVVQYSSVFFERLYEPLKGGDGGGGGGGGEGAG